MANDAQHGCRGRPMGKERSLQHMVLGQLGKRMKQNQVVLTPHTKTNLRGQRPKCKS